MDYHWSEGTTAYIFHSQFAPIFWWTNEPLTNKENGLQKTGLLHSHKQVFLLDKKQEGNLYVPSNVSLFQTLISRVGTSRYHLNSSALMGKVWFWPKTLNLSLPGELFIPLNFLSFLLTYCWAKPLLCHHSLPGLLLPLPSHYRKLAFDKTQKGESLTMKSSVPFLERH